MLESSESLLGDLGRLVMAFIWSVYKKSQDKNIVEVVENLGYIDKKFLVVRPSSWLTAMC